MLKLNVLVDNNTLIDRYFKAEPGLSFWIESDEKKVLFDTGCSHSGICNIINHARELTGVEKVLDVIGGFHLQNAGKDLMEKTVKELEKIAPDAMHPCHCTDLKAKISLGQSFRIEEVGSGLVLDYNK